MGNQVHFLFNDHNNSNTDNNSSFDIGHLKNTRNLKFLPIISPKILSLTPKTTSKNYNRNHIDKLYDNKKSF